MEDALRSRFNVLIGLCAGTFGITLTQLALGQPGGTGVIGFALIPTVVVLIAAALYIDNYGRE